MKEPLCDFPVVCFGETLWDILPSGTVPGGAPINVAYHMRNLGINPTLITRIGLDVYGKKLVELLEAQNISTDFFQLDNVLPTGKVNAAIDDHYEESFHIQKPAAWDNIAWEPAFEQLIADSKYFVYGSLAARGRVSRKTLFQLLEQAPSKVLNMNLRSPHYNRTIIAEILQKADILKLTFAELELITGWFVNFNTEYDRIQVLQDRFNIQNILVTKGSGGSLLNINGHIYYHAAFPVEVADSAGSGDAFLAGMLFKLLQSSPIEEAHEFASAIGAVVASKPGGCPEYSLEEINQFTTKDKVTSPNFK